MAIALPFTSTKTKPTIVDVGLNLHVGIFTVNTSWSVIEPYCREAVKLQVVPFIGRACYLSILAEGETGEHWDGLRDTVAHYTASIAYPRMGSVVSDAGVMSGTGGEGSMPVSLWQSKVTHLALVKAADEHMDRLAIAIDNDPGFTMDSGVEQKARLLPNTQTFTRYHHISNSLRTYRALVPSIEEAIELRLRPIMMGYVDEMPAGPVYDVLAEKARRLLAKYTIIQAAPALTILVDGSGMKTLSSSDALVGVAAAGYREALANLVATTQDIADTLKADLVAWIRTNINDLPELRATGYYDVAIDSPYVYGDEDGGAVGFF